jgi:hypothetical protein
MNLPSCTTQSLKPTRLAGGVTLLAVLLFASAAYAQRDLVAVGQDPADLWRPPIYVIPGKPAIATLYYDGRQVELASEARWRFTDGTDLTGLTVDDLRWFAENHYAMMEEGPVIVIDNTLRDGGFNVVYNAEGGVPSEALDSMAMAEAYLESLFNDDIRVGHGVTFQSMGGSVLGAAAVNYVTGVSYADSRNGLESGMDPDDVLQSWMPAGNTVPVRYNGSSTTVTNENQIDWPVAAFKSTVGEYTYRAANITINSDVSWDWDPSDGVPFSRTSFVDVLLHETGHSLGFVSAADNPGDSMDAMDLFRFQRTDADHDYNPDTYEEFQTTPRLVDYDNPDDQHNSDLINQTYRMEDGNPWQASHFRMASGHGLMCPAISSGYTGYPDYYSSADKDMFDVMGYDYPPYDCPNPGNSGNYCTADIDGSGDCVVDLLDLNKLLSNYGMTSGATHDDGDLNGDGDVDLGDLVELLDQYGDDCN